VLRVPIAPVPCELLRVTLSLPNYTFAARLSRTPLFAIYRGHRDVDGAPVLAKALAEDFPDPRELAKLRYEFALARDLDSPCMARPLALVECGHSLVLVWQDPGAIRVLPTKVPLHICRPRCG
jgi:hypothetical protein